MLKAGLHFVSLKVMLFISINVKHFKDQSLFNKINFKVITLQIKYKLLKISTIPLSS